MAMKSEEQDQSSVVAVLAEHLEAENAVNEIRNWGFDIKKLSIVGRDYHTEDHVIGFYTAGGRMKYWGKMGAFWDGLWELLAGAAFLMIPGIGPVVVAGPVTGWIVGALEGAIVIGGLSVLGAGLVSLGIPKQNVLKYETSIKAGKFLLIAHGTAEEVRRVRNILKTADAEEIETHQMSPEPVRVA
jgi:hypothetical protein